MHNQNQIMMNYGSGGSVDMNTVEGIKSASKNIVMAYVHHIRDQVRVKNDMYLDLGVDADFDCYESLFKIVMARVLGVKKFNSRGYSEEVIKECLHEVKYVITKMGYEKLLDTKIMAEFIYDICLLVLEKVKEDEFSDEVRIYH